jgi:hypothetical protein
MKYVFDIDGTICTNSSPDYGKAEPYKERIFKINELYDEGHTIIFHTARGMGRHFNNAALADLEFYNLTTNQLESWGVKYHHLFLGKPSGDIYVDDKGISDEEFFSN